MFQSLGIPYSSNFSSHLRQVDERRKRWKEFHGKTVVKRKRAHKQQATERRLIYENRTTEYAAGIGLDIGNSALAAPAKKTRTKRTQCKCGSTTHLTSRSRECKYNKNNLQLMSLCGEVKEGEAGNSVPDGSDIGKNDEKIEVDEI